MFSIQKYLGSLSTRRRKKSFDALGQIVQPEAAGRWMLPSTKNITPSYIENILRGALGGNHVQQWELFGLMEETWPRLNKNLLELKGAVRSMDWQLRPWAEEDAAPTASAVERASLVSRAVWGMSPRPGYDESAFSGMLFDIMDAWAKGVSVIELDWMSKSTPKTGEYVAPRAAWWVHPHNYAWSNEGWIGLLTENSRNQVEEFPEDKFLIGICKARSGHPLAGALLRPLAWWWCAANFSADWLLNFAQIFGLPIRWATYDQTVPGLLEKVSDMLENMGSQAWAAFPTGTTLQLQEGSKGGSDIPQSSLLDRADKQCDLLILGQTLTTDVAGSGSLALGKVHAGVREDVILSAADFAAGVVNSQLVTAILRLNYGDDSEAPEFCPEPRKKEDARANAERDALLLRNPQVKMPMAWFYKRHNIPIPAPGEEVISGAANMGTPPQGPDSFSGRLAVARDLDQMLERLTGVEGKWLGAVRETFRPLIIQARRGAITRDACLMGLRRAKAQCPEIFSKMDVSEVEAVLEDYRPAKGPLICIDHG